MQVGQRCVESEAYIHGTRSSTIVFRDRRAPSRRGRLKRWAHMSYTREEITRRRPIIIHAYRWRQWSDLSIGPNDRGISYSSMTMNTTCTHMPMPHLHVCVARLTDKTGVSVTHACTDEAIRILTHIWSMLDTEGTPNIYIERKKPAWFLLITLPHRHFVDVADNLVKRDRESKNWRNSF